ncbi:hypothetical protein ACFQ10_00020 [Streptomyces indonesiensis]
MEAGKDLRPAQFPTVESERRARLGTDMARAWWVWRRPEQTARALLGAYRPVPARSETRSVVTELADRRPLTTAFIQG